MSKVSPLSVRDFVGEQRLSFLNLEVVAGGGGLDNRFITNPRIQKPGLALAGFLPYVKPGRIQILGESEFSYLATLETKEAARRVMAIVNAGVPAVLAAKNHLPSEEVLRCCEDVGVPFLSTSLRTSDTIEGVSAFLEDALAPRTQLHGVLVDVFSLGTLIIGDPGIGKSECALELIYRGHRLVADDLVVVRRTHNHGLRGEPHRLLAHVLELRGVGIIDVRKHFGMTASSSSVEISLVIELVKLSSETRAQEKIWRQRVRESRNVWTNTQDILGIDVPKYVMAVAPGRDFALMVETAVRKCLLAQRGIDDEGVFLEAIDNIATGSAAAETSITDD